MHSLKLYKKRSQQDWSIPLWKYFFQPKNCWALE